MITTAFTASLLIFLVAFERHPYPQCQVITSFGLAAVAAWFASERWIFVHRHDHIWLDDAVNEAIQRILHLSLVVEMQKTIHYFNQHISAIGSLLRRVSSKFTDVITRIRHMDHTLPTLQEGPTTSVLSHHRETSTSVCSDVTERPKSMEGPASEENEASRQAIARQRFKGAVRSVIMMQQHQVGQTQSLYLRPFMPPRTPSFDWNSTAGMSPTRFSYIGLNAVRGPRVVTLIPKLRTLEHVRDLSVHTALVRHLQFSPSGKYLATSRWVVIGFVVGASRADTMR